MARRVTGETPVMWGPSIIGFGQRSYQLANGSEGIMPRLGFAPRSQNMVLYVRLSRPEVQQCLARLGPHKTSVACLYLKRLSGVDLEVLEEILVASL